MLLENLKTIDIKTLEWFDKVNGNSYFASRVTLNFGMENQTEIVIPFEYGYGSAHEYEAYKNVKKHFNLDDSYNLRDYIHDKKIVVRISKNKALKRELKNI